jgi:REP element-mobilizing transposase RayT
LHVPDAFYHVTLRGNHKEPLFGAAADRVRLNAFVADATERFGVRVHAFCWMTNHLHALVQIGKRPLGDFVKSVTVRYSRYRHKALDTTGHLFERRYGARLIDVDAYFLAVLRYIHLNPVKAGLVRDPRTYPWSSHRAYLGSEALDWLTVEQGLALFGAEPRSARAAYARFLRESGVDADDDFACKAHPADPRILGNDEFISGLELTGGKSSNAMTLPALAEQVCARHGISVALLRSRIASPRLTPIRVELLEQAVVDAVANLTDVARYLGRDASTLSKQWKAQRAKNPVSGT